MRAASRACAAWIMVLCAPVVATHSIHASKSAYGPTSRSRVIARPRPPPRPRAILALAIRRGLWWRETRLRGESAANHDGRGTLGTDPEQADAHAIE
jgi:hypothetical protein